VQLSSEVVLTVDNTHSISGRAALISARRALVLVVLVVACHNSGCSPPSPDSRSEVSGNEPADLVPLIDQALKAARQNRLATNRHTPWEFVHAGLGLGPDAPIWDHNQQREITVRDYFRRGGPYLSEPIYVIQKNRIGIRTSRHYSELERHPNQFLAYFAQMEFPSSLSFEVQGQTFTLADLVASAQKHFDPALETTFTLLALAYYCPQEHRWHNIYGQTFSIEDLVSLEMKAERQRLACGGTHSLSALSYALRRHGGEDKLHHPLWKAVADRLTQEQQAVQAAQEADGSFPTALVGVQEAPPPGRETLKAKIYSTGHVLELLLLTLPEEELRAPWVRRAARFLCDAVIQCSFDPPPASPWYHALHALQMYRKRVS
jgi:hypothetical protein